MKIAKESVNVMRSQQKICGAVVKNLPANARDERDTSSIPRLGRASGGGNDNLIQYFCLENFMDRGKPGELQSMGSQKVRHNWATKYTHTHGEKEYSLNKIHKAGGISGKNKEYLEGENIEWKKIFFWKQYKGNFP